MLINELYYIRGRTFIFDKSPKEMAMICNGTMPNNVNVTNFLTSRAVCDICPFPKRCIEVEKEDWQKLTIKDNNV